MRQLGFHGKNSKLSTLRALRFVLLVFTPGIIPYLSSDNPAHSASSHAPPGLNYPTNRARRPHLPPSSHPSSSAKFVYVAALLPAPSARFTLLGRTVLLLLINQALNHQPRVDLGYRHCLLSYCRTTLSLHIQTARLSVCTPTAVWVNRRLAL